MKLTILFFFSFIMMTSVSQETFSQKTGSFDVSVDFKGETRTLSLYVPNDYDETKEYDLLVGLHGMGDNSKNYRNSLMQYLYWNTVFSNTIFVFPDGGGDRGRDFYTPVGDQGIIDLAINYAKNNYSIKDGDIILQGFSLGGRSALKYGLDHPEYFKGLLLHTPAMQSLKDPINITPFSLVYKYENAYLIPIIITNGGEDLLYINSIRSLVEQLTLHDAPVMHNFYQDMGHSIPRTASTQQHLAFINSPMDDDLNVEWLDVIMDERSCSYMVSPVCRVRNTSIQKVNSIEFEYISPVETKTFTWESSYSGLVSFEHVDIELPEIEIEEGFNTIVAKIIKINGEEFNSLQNEFEFRVEMIAKGQKMPVVETFDNQQSLMHWYIDASFHWTTWGLDSDVKRSGTYSVTMFNTILLLNNRGISEDLLTPYIDLTSEDVPELSFDLAFNYHYYTPPYVNNDMMFTDTLEILISTDCGETYSSIYRKWGEDLATASKPILNPADLNQIFFIPNDNQWRLEQIDLSDYKDADKSTFIFRYTSGLGGCINIDNVRFKERQNISVADDNFNRSSLFPNPASDYSNLILDTESAAKLEIKMYDLLSYEVMQIYSGSHNGGSFSKRIDLADVPSGVYFIRVRLGDQDHFEKLIVK